MKQRLVTIGNAVAVFAALLLLWQLVLWIFHVPPYMLPLPLVRGARFGFALLFPAGVFDYYRRRAAAGGWPGSIVVGVLIALLFAQFRWVRRMLYPYTLLLQTVPIVAIAPLILMWVGAGTPAVAFIAFIISLAPIIANATQGLISVDENLVNLFLMHNASPAQVLLKLRLPHAVPSLFVGIRIASGIAVNRRHHRRTLCRIEPRRRGRPGLFHPVRVFAASNRLSFRFGAGRDRAGLFLFLSGDVFRVVFSSQVARIGSRPGNRVSALALPPGE